MPRFSVVLSTYNDDHRLALSLAGYARQAFRDFEVIVVNDGGSRDGAIVTSNLVRTFADTANARDLYLEPESTDFRLAEARNLGIRHARGETLVFSDGDCVPAPDMLQVLSSCVRDDRILVGTRKRVHVSMIPFLAPADVASLDSLYYSVDRRLAHPLLAPMFAEMKDCVPPHSWRLCWGCLFAAPASKVKAIGGFDERFREWGREDEDLAERLVRGMGCRFLSIPEAFVYHLDHERVSEDTSTRDLLDRIRQDWTLVRNDGPIV